jgi:hypothetical protein
VAPYWPSEQPTSSVVLGPGWFGQVSGEVEEVFVPLVLVVDRRLYLRWGANITAIHERCLELGRRVSSLYSALGLVVVLVGVEVWAHGDRVKLAPSADTSLDRFLVYRRTVLAR